MEIKNWYVEKQWYLKPWCWIHYLQNCVNEEEQEEERTEPIPG